MDLVQQFITMYGRVPQVFRCPGRVNLIGEHTDYNQGFVFPMLIDQETHVALAARRDKLIRVYALNKQKGVILDLSKPSPKRAPLWHRYIEGTLKVLMEKGYQLTGADVMIYSDVPMGAGLSSSAAIEVALGYAFLSLSGYEVNLKELAFAGQAAEHRFVGTQCGIMDQMVCSVGRQGHAVLLDCRSMEVEHIPLNMQQYTVLITDSKVKHALASSEYNTRRAECNEGVKLLQRYLPTIHSLRDVSPEDLAAHIQHLPLLIAKRCRHVVSENARVLQAAQYLKSGNMQAFGQLLYASHASLRDDYEVSCKELDILVEIAHGLPGVYGSRMTGGGFGGCTVSLVLSEQVETFKANMLQAYASQTGKQADIYIAHANAGVSQIV